MQNGQIDSNGDAIIYDLKELVTQGIEIGFNAVPYYAEPNIKITNTLGASRSSSIRFIVSGE